VPWNVPPRPTTSKEQTGNWSSLCVNLSVPCGSAVTASLHPLKRRDAEDAEVNAESSKDHPDSNYRMADDALVSHVPIPPSNVHRFKGEPEPGASAKRKKRSYVPFSRTSTGPFLTWSSFASGKMATLPHSFPTQKLSLNNRPGLSQIGSRNSKQCASPSRFPC
jgi:hypothetical protein